MKKFIAGAMMATGLVLLAASPVVAAKGNPHHEEQDGCDHGHTGKPCKPDPQPDHGKECQKHGKHGGVNEDHCQNTTTTTQLPTTTTTEPPTTTTTEPPVTTTTLPESVDTTTTTVLTPEDVETSVIVQESPEGTSCVTPDGYPYTTSYDTCPPAAQQPASEVLAHTGAATNVLVLFGLGLLLTGLGLKLRLA